MPGVIVRKVSGHSDVVKFEYEGVATDQYLDHEGFSSNLVGYKTMAPGSIGAITSGCTVPVAGDVKIFVVKNGSDFFNITILDGTTELNVTYNPGDYAFNSLDKFAVRIEGSATNLRVQLKII